MSNPTVMEAFLSNSGFGTEANLAGQGRPVTPPYTPAKPKRRLERSDSPASSIHPTETSSPARKFVKRKVPDDIFVQELAEGDVGYLTDIDVVYPEELEEVDDDTDRASESEVDAKSDSGISTHLANLRCDDEAEMQKKRMERRLSRRTGSRVFKRSHSKSVKSDTEATDSDAMNDQDVEGGARRLRRRVNGPNGGGVKHVFDEDPRSSPDLGSMTGSGDHLQQDASPDVRSNAYETEAMDIE